MRAYLDTDVLVALVAERHPAHRVVAATLSRLGVSATDLRISVHTVAEAYATLTKSVLPYGGEPREIAQTLRSVIDVIAYVIIDLEAYQRALAICSKLQIARAGIYDALHVAAAEHAGCDALLTLNVKHFERMASATPLRFVYPARP